MFEVPSAVRERLARTLLAQPVTALEHPRNNAQCRHGEDYDHHHAGSLR